MVKLKHNLFSQGLQNKYCVRRPDENYFHEGQIDTNSKTSNYPLTQMMTKNYTDTMDAKISTEPEERNRNTLRTKIT